MWWQRGHQDRLNTTGNVTTQAILHPQLAETGTMALSRRGLGSSVQRVGRSIMNERGNLNIFTTTTTPTQNVSFVSAWCEILWCLNCLSVIQHSDNFLNYRIVVGGNRGSELNKLVPKYK